MTTRPDPELAAFVRDEPLRVKPRPVSLRARIDAYDAAVDWEWRRNAPPPPPTWAPPPDVPDPPDDPLVDGTAIDARPASTLLFGACMAVLAAIFAAWLLGCSPAVQVDAAVASGKAGQVGHAALSAVYQHEQERCYPLPRPEVVPCVEGVRARYAAAWKAYELYRAMWLALASEAEKGRVDIVAVIEATKAAAAFEAAVEAARRTP